MATLRSVFAPCFPPDSHRDDGIGEHDTQLLRPDPRESKIHDLDVANEGLGWDFQS